MIRRDIERPDDLTLAYMFEEMEDWLWENHEGKVIDIEFVRKMHQDLDNDDDDDDDEI